jgi:hypothetical protein
MIDLATKLMLFLGYFVVIFIWGLFLFLMNNRYKIMCWFTAYFLG